MKKPDIFDAVLEFITTTKKSLIIYSRDFNVTLYFNVDINNKIMSLLKSGKSIDINYEEPEGTEKILEGLKKDYNNNFSFSKTLDESKPQDSLPDFIIKDDKEIIIFMGNTFDVDNQETMILGAKKRLEKIKINSTQK
jgi:hypothetical protein